MDFLAYLMKNETRAGGLVWKRGKMTELESFHIYTHIYAKYSWYTILCYF